MIDKRAVNLNGYKATVIGAAVRASFDRKNKFAHKFHSLTPIMLAFKFYSRLLEGRELEEDNHSQEPVEMSPHSAAQLLLAILFGLLLSQLAETVLHRYHIYAVPGSGAVILIGMITGWIIMAVNHKWEVELEVS